MLFTYESISESDDLVTSLLLPAVKAELSITFCEHDERLRLCIQGAVQRVGLWCGRSMVSKSVTVAVAQAEIGETLPIRPVRSITSVTLSDDTPATVSEWLGTDKRTLLKAVPANVTLTVVAEVGAETMPDALKQAVVMLAATAFDHQPRDWKNYANPFRYVTA